MKVNLLLIFQTLKNLNFTLVKTIPDSGGCAYAMNSNFK
jgi:hypothetical protein